MAIISNIYIFFLNFFS